MSNWSFKIKRILERNKKEETEEKQLGVSFNIICLLKKLKSDEKERKEIKWLLEKITKSYVSLNE